MSLVLTRKLGESVEIKVGDVKVDIRVVQVRGKQARLSFHTESPDSVQIERLDKDGQYIRRGE